MDGLYVACSQGNLEALREGLLASAAVVVGNPNWQNPLDGGNTLLHTACLHGRLAIIEVLLAEVPGLSINQLNAAGETPLALACMWRRVAVIQRLLQTPHLDPNRAGQWVQLPIFSAIVAGCGPAVTLLLDDPRTATADPGWGRTLFEWACQVGSTDLVLALLAHPRLDPNLPNRLGGGNTPVMQLVKAGKRSLLAEVVLSPRVDLNACNDAGETALWQACVRGDIQTAWILLGNPHTRLAVLGRTTRCQRTPGEVAELHRHTKLARMLEYYAKYPDVAARFFQETRDATDENDSIFSSSSSCSSSCPSSPSASPIEYQKLAD